MALSVLSRRRIKGPVRRLQPFCCFRVPARLNGDEESLLELRLGPEKTGIEKFHDGPEIADIVLNRCAGECNAVVCLESPWRPSPVWSPDS